MTPGLPAVPPAPMPSAPIVVPVGLYTGPLYPGPGQPLRYHSVRIGRLTVTIPTEPAFAVWLAAHRPPDRADQRWTRQALLDLAHERGATNAATVLTEYLADGLVVELDPDSPAAVIFAHEHRVVPLVPGLGNTAADPGRYGLGLLGQPPMVRVPALVYDVVQWGCVSDSLWEVCEAFAAASVDAAGAEPADDPAEGDPRHVLATFLEALPALLSVHAVHIDEARRP